MAETLSTLKFAQRAKAIKNSAILNEESTGSIQALQLEIVRLKSQLAGRNSEPVNGDQPSSDQACEDMASLAVTLRDSLQRCKVSDEQRMQTHLENQLLEEKVTQFEKGMMSVKLMLKMREADISKLKKKDPSLFDDSVDERIKMAVDTINQEMKCQKLKDHATVSC